jgi:putative ABC transport system substrate-binding protein
MTARREVIVALALGVGALCAALPSRAQQAGKLWRIGFLAGGARPASLASGALAEFSRGMRELGYVEGRHFVIEWRFAEGKTERFAELAAQLVESKVDVMVAATTNGVSAAKRATSTIPVVMVTVANPIGTGLIASFARPGGNITGLSNVSFDVSIKYLELLRVAIPRLARVAVLINPGGVTRRGFFERIEGAAKTAGVKVSPLEAQTAAEIDAAFGAIARERIGALILTPDPFFSVQAPRIAALAVKNRLPTMFWTREHVATGGLMSYGQDNADHYRRAATFVDKILKGARPGDLPVEQPMKLQLVINRRTAKALGLALPQELLLRTDEVIE